MPFSDWLVQQDEGWRDYSKFYTQVYRVPISELRAYEANWVLGVRAGTGGTCTGTGTTGTITCTSTTDIFVSTDVGRTVLVAGESTRRLITGYTSTKVVTINGAAWASTKTVTPYRPNYWGTSTGPFDPRLVHSRVIQEDPSYPGFGRVELEYGVAPISQIIAETPGHAVLEMRVACAKGPLKQEYSGEGGDVIEGDTYPASAEPLRWKVVGTRSNITDLPTTSLVRIHTADTTIDVTTMESLRGKTNAAAVGPFGIGTLKLIGVDVKTQLPEMAMWYMVYELLMDNSGTPWTCSVQAHVRRVMEVPVVDEEGVALSPAETRHVPYWMPSGSAASRSLSLGSGDFSGLAGKLTWMNIS